MLMHSALACHFYSVPFPSHESTEVLLGLYFNSLSPSLYTVSNSFKFRLSFAKEVAALSRGAALFLLCTPWGIHLAFGDVLPQKSEDD